MNLEDYNTMLVTALEMEDKSLFYQGDLIIAGVEEFGRKTAYGRFCHYARKSERTAKQRHKVSAIFDESRRSPILNWTFHSLCAGVADLRKPETWNKAYEWLDRATGLIADGREYSTDDLLNDMKASGDDPNADKPVYIADKANAIIVGADTKSLELTLKFADLEPFKRIQAGMVLEAREFVVTIVQKVQELHKSSVSKP